MFFPQSIPEVILIKPKRFGDERGFFSETFHDARFEENGVHGPFVQDNHSLSRQKGVVRGLHFQIPPTPQAKLVRCTRGAILDVAVDIRAGSPTFGKHVAAELTADNGWQLYVPVGFAHGFATLVPDTEVQYKVTGYYAPDCDRGLAFDDPALGIDWPVGRGDAVLSDKDRAQPLLAGLPEHFRYGA
ncbi:MAG: dTDP-4-dehydrorhamnose 3,5-epimerase [Amphiplicatus sp.]